MTSLATHLTDASPDHSRPVTFRPDSRCSLSRTAPLAFVVLVLTSLFLPCDHSARLQAAQTTSAATGEIRIIHAVRPEQTMNLACQVAIRGRIIAPANNGTTELDLVSDAQFTFAQRQFPSQVVGPFSLRAIRRFGEAMVTTTVGPDHKTTVQLPETHRLLQVYGTDTSLLHLSPDVHLTRQQVDLLQMPCDPLVATHLLPSRTLASQSDKWNTDIWVLPLLVGMEASVSQSLTCQLTSLTDTRATIAFTGSADGAVSGSASQIALDGQMTVDRPTGTILQLKARLKEKRSPGTISPGLDVTVDVVWTQSLTTGASDLPQVLPEQLPADSSLQLTLATPWRLMLLHSREWHLFHETAELVMLRMLRNGSLVAQCNISPALTMPAGQFTPDDQFRSEVLTALASRQGLIVSSRVIPDLNGWRMHQVRASSEASSKKIFWDYYLCTQKTGEQFLVIFSHAEPDAAAFGDSADRILKTLTLRPLRPRITLPR